MRLRCALAITFVLGALFATARAENYAVDAAHASVTFKISHLGISWIHGRFNNFSGNFSAGGNDAAFNLTINADSIDTAIPKRDGHLKSPDFFNVQQFPTIAFKSTSVKSAGDGYDVTGDLTMHGVTKPVTMKLVGGKTAEFPKGVQRIGFSTDLVLKRSDFGMDKLVGPVGDKVHVAISFEGTKK